MKKINKIINEWAYCKIWKYKMKLCFKINIFFLKKKKKLKTIINNNELQKRIGYNIENYKKCSGILKLKLENGNVQ